MIVQRSIRDDGKHRLKREVKWVNVQLSWTLAIVLQRHGVLSMDSAHVSKVIWDLLDVQL